MYTILSIDGGGIRGIIPGQVMVALEDKLNQRVQQNPALSTQFTDGVRLADFFDFFAGTSTGGILTSIYLCPDPHKPGRARFSAQEAVDLYVKNGQAIFDVSVFQKIKSGDGVLDEKHDAAALEGLLKKYFGKTRLRELLRPCLITAYEIEQRKTQFFNQQDARTKGDMYDFLVRDICRATSAAPTYFEAARITSLDGTTYSLIDGGIFANNPALCAYSEVRTQLPQLTAKDMLIVSLGTGSDNESYPYDKAKNWGEIGWVRPVIDIMMSGAAEVTDYHLTKMFQAVDHPEQYMRFQPTNLGAASSALDNAEPKNLAALVQVGKITAKTCDNQLNHLADLLITHKLEQQAPAPVNA